MACDRCELTALVEGRRVHVRTWFEQLEKLAWSDVTNCFLYQCPTCCALWELCAYEKAARDISAKEAREWYPTATIRESPRSPSSGS